MRQPLVNSKPVFMRGFRTFLAIFSQFYGFSPGLTITLVLLDPKPMARNCSRYPIPSHQGVDTGSEAKQSRGYTDASLNVAKVRRVFIVTGDLLTNEL